LVLGLEKGEADGEVLGVMDGCTLGVGSIRLNHKETKAKRL